MIEYTSGSMTVNDNYTDTNSASPKNISVPDLDYNTDFAVSKDEPDELVIVNTSESDLVSQETIRYARSVVQNVYRGNPEIDSSNQAATKKGVQVMAEVKSNYEAVNGDTGEVTLLPCKGRIVLQLPNAPYVQTDILADLLNRVIAAAFLEGSTDDTLVSQLAKGILNPKTA